MGDRTFCRIEVAPDNEAQKAVLVDYGFDNDFGDHEGEFADSEANYGGLETIDELKALALPFVGSHDEGGDYSATVFAFDGKDFAQVASVDQLPSVTVSESGALGGLDDATEYWRIFKAAKAVIDAAVTAGIAPLDDSEDTTTHKQCPECEKPNQFGELCDSCRRECEDEANA